MKNRYGGANLKKLKGPERSVPHLYTPHAIVPLHAIVTRLACKFLQKFPMCIISPHIPQASSEPIGSRSRIWGSLE